MFDLPGVELKLVLLFVKEFKRIPRDKRKLEATLQLKYDAFFNRPNTYRFVIQNLHSFYAPTGAQEVFLPVTLPASIVSLSLPSFLRRVILSGARMRCLTLIV